ncbi:hypothetical protein [Cohnella sp. GCM10027633]|uniref:hypothetical protein n=1 Tax=unclassified Cohnella TaxID=2636738 RepID=UPI0036342F39
MKKSLFVVSLLALLTIDTPIYASANEPVQNYSDQPDSFEIERQKKYELPAINAWEMSSSGEKIQVQPRNYDGPQSRVPNDGFSYVFDSYVQSSTQYDQKRFFIGKVWIENTNSAGTTPISLKYTQQTSKTTNWEVSANINATAEFKVAFLAKLNASLSLSGKYVVTDNSSTTVEQSAQVPGRTYYEINKYRAGGYGAGQAAYRKYSPGGGSLIGMYYEGASGWAPDENVVGWSHSSHLI